MTSREKAAAALRSSIDKADRRNGVRTIRQRYLLEVRRWVGGRTRIETRARLHETTRKRRLRAMHMALFYALGDYFVKVGTVDDLSLVGEFTNGVLSGRMQTPPNRWPDVAPLVRLYRRTEAAARVAA